MNKQEIKKSADGLVDFHYKIIESIKYVQIGDSELLRASEKAAIVTVKKQKQTLQEVYIEMISDDSDVISNKHLELSFILKELESRL